MANSVLSLKITKKIVDKIYQKFSKFFVENKKNANVLYSFKLENLMVTIYTNNTLLLQGEKSELDKFLEFLEMKSSVITKDKKVIKKTLPKSVDGTIGCDEVGTGDYFGPVVTCACYLPKSNELKVKSLGVTDSKKLIDAQILILAKKIKPLVSSQVCVCEPKIYNGLIKKFNNSNIIKAICHNDALTKLKPKLGNISYTTIMDQFVNEKKYWWYLKTADIISSKIDIFETKAESKYLSVAAASILAKACFLEKMAVLSKQCNLNLPLGSSSKQVVIIGKILIKKNKLEDYAKTHFESITNEISK